MPSMVKKSNRKDRKDLRKAHQEKLLNALKCLLWFQTSQTIKKTSMTYMFMKFNHNAYMLFNALHGYKPYKPLKKNFNDLYV
jgi:hypothetical protein